jgi:hypothetical protein
MIKRRQTGGSNVPKGKKISGRKSNKKRKTWLKRQRLLHSGRKMRERDFNN